MAESGHVLGTGLGLSICYGIIHKMGGEITVKSILDVGTTFSIRIPVKTDDPSQGEVQPVNKV